MALQRARTRENDSTAATAATNEIADHARAVVEAAPPLTSLQRDRLAALLWGGSHAA